MDHNIEARLLSRKGELWIARAESALGAHGRGDSYVRKKGFDLSGNLPYFSGMGQQPIRSARLEARISPEALAVVKRAAEIQGRSISDFVVAAAQAAAERTVEETQILRLSIDDQRAFVDSILNPPEPGAAMRRAAAAHRTLIKKSI